MSIPILSFSTNSFLGRRTIPKTNSQHLRNNSADPPEKDLKASQTTVSKHDELRPPTASGNFTKTQYKVLLADPKRADEDQQFAWL